jgi:4-hydroxy-2-oxoheptanedioate aldolase
MLFIGPNDLAFSMGFMPGSTDPKFNAAVDKIVGAAKNAGLPVGTLVANGKLAQEAKERFQFVVVGGDVKAMQFWFAEQLGLAKS